MDRIELTLIEDKGYDTEEIKRKLPKDLSDAFFKWFHGKTGFVSQDGRFCVFKDDYDLWVSLRRKVLTANV